MPVFAVEVVEVVAYRGRIEAEDEGAARRAALADLVAQSGDGIMAFLEVADRTAAIVED
jgi:hypothetical protein